MVHSGRVHPSSHSVENENDESVEFLLNNGADVHSIDENGATALHRAVRRASITIVKTLLSHSANINARDTSLCTPLHTCMYGDVELAKFLLRNGGDEDAIEERGKTAIQTVAEIARLDMFITIIEAGCNPTIRSADGESALTVVLQQSSMRAYVSRVRSWAPGSSSAIRWRPSFTIYIHRFLGSLAP